MLPERVTAALRGVPGPVCAYVYDTSVLRERVAAVRAAVPEGATVLYAVKANGTPGVVAALAEVADGLEVASGGELELAVRAGARHIAFSGPAKTDEELGAAIAAGATVNVESLLELRRLAALAGTAPAQAPPVRIALRVNRAGPTLPGSHRMTGVPTPFGLDISALDEAVALVRGQPRLDPVGFHLHAVSNNLDAPAHAAFIADALDWSRRAADRYGLRLREVNVGGGFGIDHTGMAHFDLGALRGALPGDVPLVFELGRFLATPAGWYAAEVLDLKRNHGRWFAVLRGGTHHFRLPAAWGYSHPFTVLPVPDWRYGFDRPEVRDVAVDAVGELCTPRDVLTRGQRVDRLRVGDVLVFGNAGGYGWDISHHDFLRHEYPRIVVI
ncbi:alanine racemase [Rugosimonospora africana]|uniref:Diaminopimelate decarboxylase n=1 Tax=Rugosimonospora africana TaxID=556532 RepID=A0A8J3R1G9_9ACTN|nr:alanine racemase [Rugosimonospora africana]GIH20092.1 diaminopimelate decarboxylase [Rugosimonospora africana]